MVVVTLLLVELVHCVVLETVPSFAEVLAEVVWMFVGIVDPLLYGTLALWVGWFVEVFAYPFEVFRNLMGPALWNAPCVIEESE